jgi:hypothetical protein
MSGFADRIFEYFAILQQMSGFADRIPIFGYFEILLQVQLQVLGTGTVSAPQIRILVDNLFQDIVGYLAQKHTKTHPAAAVCTLIYTLN